MVENIYILSITDILMQNTAGFNDSDKSAVAAKFLAVLY